MSFVGRRCFRVQTVLCVSLELCVGFGQRLLPYSGCNLGLVVGLSYGVGRLGMAF